MVTFIVMAAILAALAAGLVAVPLLRHADGAKAPAAPWAALVSIALVVFGGSVLYVTWSNWTWAPGALGAAAAAIPEHGAAAAGDGSAEAVIGRLARRLEKDPSDLAGWLMLGRSYAATEQYALAERAFTRADKLAGGKDPEALVGMAEAMLMQDEGALAGRAGELFEQVLRIEPEMQKALFFGGIAAMRRGELPLARDRFQKLLDAGPPENVRPLLQQQLDAIEAQIGGAPGPVAAGAGKPAVAAAAPPASQPAAGGGDAAVRVTLDASPAVKAKLGGGAPLFVFVRDPSAPGPPLAVKRLAAQFPQDVDLTSADSMTGDSALAPGREVTVVARVSLGGMPNARSGDPFGEIRYRIGKDGRAKLTIDRVTP